MNKWIVLAAFVAVWVPSASALAQEKFEKAKIYFEQNVQDKDVEVKFDVIGGSAGLATVKVTAPDGRTVVDFKAGDSKMGIRHLILETPEPKNDGTIEKDFPAGVYKFTGTLVGGKALQGESTLSHTLPAAASFLRPRPDEKNVPLKGLRASWAAQKNLEAIVIILEQEKTGRDIRVTLAGDATSFAVPDGFLQPGMEYKIAVGTVAVGGNASFYETSFTTAGVSALAKTADISPAATPGGGKAISQDDAKQIALKAVPGKAINVAVEKQKGINRYVVEVVPTAGGKELDVIIDMASGKVLGIEK